MVKKDDGLKMVTLPVRGEKLGMLGAGPPNRTVQAGTGAPKEILCPKFPNVHGM